MTYAARIMAATSKQLDHAAEVMTTVLGPWDSQKAKGGSAGILTWAPSNPAVMKFKNLKKVTLEYKDNKLTLGLWYNKTQDDVMAVGTSWPGVRKDLKRDLPQYTQDQEWLTRKILEVKL